MSVGTGRQNIIILFWKFCLGRHKWETDIYIGFSPAFHLQCSFSSIIGKRWKEHGHREIAPTAGMDTGKYILLLYLYGGQGHSWDRQRIDTEI
jgi:hypothetical protein